MRRIYSCSWCRGEREAVGRDLLNAAPRAKLLWLEGRDPSEFPQGNFSVYMV